MNFVSKITQTYYSLLSVFRTNLEEIHVYLGEITANYSMHIVSFNDLTVIFNDILLQHLSSCGIAILLILCTRHSKPTS